MKRLFTFLLVLLVALANGAKLLGSPKCTWGPGYWCGSIKTAQTCASLPYCVKTEWSKNGMLTDSLPCEMCKSTFDEINKLVQSKATKQEIEQSVMSICDQLPQSFVAECKEVVSENFDDLYAKLELLVDNGPIFCSALGLCSDIKHRHPVEDEQVKKQMDAVIANAKNAFQFGVLPAMTVKLTPMAGNDSSATCNHCTAFHKDFAKTVASQPAVVEYWENLIVSQCDALPGAASDLCQTELKKEFKTILEEFAAQNSTKLCMEMNMCTGAPSKPSSEGNCPDCKNFMVDLQTDIKNKGNITTGITHLLKQECEKAGSLKQVCESVIDQGMEGAWNLISKNDADNICTTLFFCEEDKQSSDKSTDSNVISTPVDVPPQLNCDHCMNLMTDFKEEAVNNPKIVNHYVDLAVQQCKRLSFLEQLACESAVKDQARMVLHKAQVMNVGVVCTAMEMCSAPPSSNKTYGGDVCNNCVDFTKDWKNLITQNQTFLNKKLPLLEQAVCNEAPDFLRKSCMKHVKTIVAEGIEKIKNTDATQQCSEVMLCENKNEKSVPMMTLTNAATPSKLSQLKYQGSIVCETCTEVSKAIGKVISEKSTEDDITKSLDDLCMILPGQYNDVCEDLISVYTVEIIGAIQQGLDSGELCQFIGVCMKEKVAEKSTKLSQYKPSVVCETCTEVSRAVAKVLSEKSTKDQITKELDAVCMLLPGEYKTVCKDLIDVYTLDFIQAIQQGLDENQLCSFIGVCMKGNDQNATVPAKVQSDLKSDLPCELCLTLAKQLDDMIDDQTTQAEIEQALDSVCELLPSNLKDTCDTLVAQYTPQLIDLLLQQVTPKKLCAELQLCPESQKVLKAKSEVGCNLCTVVTTYLDDVIGSESTKQDVEAALDKVCDLLPAKYANNCKTYVEVFAPELIDLLLQEESPQKICKQVGLCNVTQKAHVQQIQSEVKFGPVCTLCETVAAKLENMLIGKVTKDSVETALNTVCSLLPSSEEKSCDNYVKMYSSVITELLISGVGPKLLCTSLGLCAGVQEKAAHEKMMKGEYCGICELIAGKLEDQIKDKTNEAQIEAALEKVCSYLPSSYKSECDTLVQQYTPQIIDLLVNDVSPKDLCTEIGLCSAEKLKKLKSGEYCGICELMAGKLEEFVKDKSTEAEIEADLEKVCSYLPSSYKSTCDLLVEQYTPQIIDLLVNDVSPKDICTELGLCDALKSKVVPMTELQPSSKPSVKPEDNKVENVEGQLSCDLCHVVVQIVDDKLNEKATFEEIESHVQEVCKLMPSKVTSQCNKFVDDKLHQVVAMVTKNMGVNEVCQELSICPKKSEVPAKKQEVPVKTQESNVVRMSKIQPANQDAALDISSNHRAEKLKFTNHNVGDSTPCDICKLILEDLEQNLAANSTEDEIEQFLMKACDVLPDNSQAFCIDIVKEYIPEIIDAFLDKESPSAICKNIGLCEQLVGVDKCTFGPSFWCKDMKSAIQCNAVAHCKQHFW